MAFWNDGYEMSYKKFRLDINGLRAFAVLSVVLYHFSVPYVSGGFVGVDIFFVISGFLMTGIVLERVDHKGVLDFYIARFLRIVPALAVVVFALMVFGLFTLSTNEFELLSKNAISSLLFYSNNYYAIHSSYFDPSSEYNFLLHTWSLSAEWQFYIIYPLLVIAIKKLRIPVGIALSTIFVISLAVTLMGVTGTREDIFYLLPTRAWEMISGGLVYIASSKFKLPHWLKHFDACGISIIVLSVIMLHSDGYWPSYLTLMPISGAILVLLANNQKSILTSNMVSQWVGKISYSVYLWHWPVIVSMKYYEIDLNLINVAFGIVASFLIGDISYRIIESTLRKRDKLLLNIIIFILALLSSLIILYTKGAAFRFDGTLKQVAEYRMDKSKWKENTCFLSTNQGPDAFSKCYESMNESSIVFWGDSHAAQYIPAMSAVFGNKFNVVQRTAALCGPIPGHNYKPNPMCQKINDYVFTEIIEKKPNTVVMAGLWNRYPIREDLDSLVSKIHNSGVKRIIIIGPIPYWNDTALNNIEKYGINDSGSLPVSLLKESVNVFGNDRFLRDLSKKHDYISYISPLEDMCSNNYCKTIIYSEKTAYPIQFDNSHLSIEGAIWLINKNRNYFN